MKNSSIEWTDHTFNPWEGCTKVSEGCKNCYAETLVDKRFGRVKWGKGNPRRRTSEATWKQPLKWNSQGLLCVDCNQPIIGVDCECGQVGAIGKMRRPRVFCASLADIFDEEAPNEWRHDLFQLIEKCENLDFQILTKRPEKAQRYLTAVFPRKIPSNIWLGVSVENQEQADKRIPILLQIPAAVRFLSMEPLLGPVDLQYPTFNGADSIHRLEGIHWVIVGGESGHNARPMHPDWARSLRDQCQASNKTPFLFKQWGEWCPATSDYGVSGHVMPETGEKFTWIGWDGKTQNPSAHNLVEPVMGIAKQGKKIAGRSLDGREWNQFPILKSEISNLKS